MNREEYDSRSKAITQQMAELLNERERLRKEAERIAGIMRSVEEKFSKAESQLNAIMLAKEKHLHSPESETARSSRHIEHERIIATVEQIKDEAV